jgi:catechol 2,3-dioxygenase-like lactoylglutathione lyase family enzyme
VPRAVLDNAAAVFITPDVRRAAAFYHDVFGFKVVEHFDNPDEAFAAIYRDSVEILLVQARFGEVKSNAERFGAGFDIYLDTDTVAGIDDMYAELEAKGADIEGEPAISSYGCYEFVVRDVDGRRIGIGRIAEHDTFFHGVEIG